MVGREASSARFEFGNVKECEIWQNSRDRSSRQVRSIELENCVRQTDGVATELLARYTACTAYVCANQVHNPMYFLTDVSLAAFKLSDMDDLGVRLASSKH
jgi:hypothetical protein